MDYHSLGDRESGEAKGKAGPTAAWGHLKTKQVGVDFADELSFTAAVGDEQAEQLI